MSDDRTNGDNSKSFLSDRTEPQPKSFLSDEPITLAEAIELDAAMTMSEVIAEVRLVRWMMRERGPYPELPKA